MDPRRLDRCGVASGAAGAWCGWRRTLRGAGNSLSKVTVLFMEVQLAPADHTAAELHLNWIIEDDQISDSSFTDPGQNLLCGLVSFVLERFIGNMLNTRFGC